MNGAVHTIIGISSGLIGSVLLYDKIPHMTDTALAPALFMVGTSLGAVAPDIDLHQKTNGLFTHRGFTHTLVVPMLSLALLFLPGVSELPIHTFIYGWVWGYLTHIFADMWQSAGVPIMWPLYGKHVHICSMPVKYDKIWVFFYILILLLIGHLFGGFKFLERSINSSNSMPIFLAIIVSIFLIRRKIRIFHKRRKKRR